MLKNLLDSNQGYAASSDILFPITVIFSCGCPVTLPVVLKPSSEASPVRFKVKLFKEPNTDSWISRDWETKTSTLIAFSQGCNFLYIGGLSHLR